MSTNGDTRREQYLSLLTDRPHQVGEIALAIYAEDTRQSRKAAHAYLTRLIEAGLAERIEGPPILYVAAGMGELDWPTLLKMEYAREFSATRPLGWRCLRSVRWMGYRGGQTSDKQAGLHFDYERLTHAELWQELHDYAIRYDRHATGQLVTWVDGTEPRSAAGLVLEWSPNNGRPPDTWRRFAMALIRQGRELADQKAAYLNPSCIIQDRHGAWGLPSAVRDRFGSRIPAAWHPALRRHIPDEIVNSVETRAKDRFDKPPEPMSKPSPMPELPADIHEMPTNIRPGDPLA